MKFTKSEMQDELLKFMSLFGQHVAALYGASDPTWTNDEAIKHSPVWGAMNELYDYGVMGIPTGELVPGNRLNGIHAHVEMFIRALDTSRAKIFLAARDNEPPRLCLFTVQLAVARMVLDGGDRYTDYGASEYGILQGDTGYLTFSEIAMLANMDERSVRNAANPKLPNPLKPELKGTRSLVKIEEACRWLAGRKGFTPTKPYDGPSVKRAPEFDISFTEEDFKKIEEQALKEGVSFWEYLSKNIQIKVNSGGLK